MTSLEFVEKLKALSPSESKIKEIESDEEFVKEYLENYNLKKLKTDSITIDPLLDLIYKYDVSSLDISMISFNNEKDVLETDKYILFGKEEADALVIDKLTNQVLLLDSEDPSYVIDKCSKDTSSFLDALLLVAEFNQKMFFDEELAENQLAIKEKATQIAEVAGGKEYLSFYLNSLGYEGE